MGGGSGYTGGITGADNLEDMARRRIAELQNIDKICHIFVPHAWDYEQEYQRLVCLLHGVEGFEFKNYSVPKDDPLDCDSNKDLEQALRRQMEYTSVVVIPAGMYVNYRKWIQKEIDLAKEMKKPIIAVKPWGSEQIPSVIRDCADEIVGWNKESIVEAINRARAKKHQ